jgi:branched-chain amino acid aminotransferase
MLYFNFDGKIYKEGVPIIGPVNRGLRYGDGLFETLKYTKGQIILANEHFARLWKGMQVLQLQVPKHFTPEKLQEEILALIKKNGHEKMARVRLTVFRGDGGLYDAVNHIPHYIIETWALPDENGEWNSNGLVLGIYEMAYKNCDILSNIKHNNYLPYVLAALEAKKEKWNDAIVLNHKGHLCDTTIANIFLIKDEVIYTPALTEGCVSGIMRKHILLELKKMNYIIREGTLTRANLQEADEVFLTNSIYNIRWVQRMNEKKYSNTITHKIYLAIIPTIS